MKKKTIRTTFRKSWLMKESIHSLIMMEMDKKMKTKMKETLQLLCNKLKVSMAQIPWS